MSERERPGADALRAGFEKLSEALLVVDDTRRVVDANGAARALLGGEQSTLSGAVIDELPESLWDLIASGTGDRIEVEVSSAEGRRSVLAVSSTPNALPGLHLLLLRDISARRKRETMSERYELLVRHTHDIVLFLDRHGKIIEANDAAVNAYGYTREELLDLTVADLRNPATRFEVEPQIERAFATGVNLETMHRRKDGTEFPVEVGSRSAMVGGELMLLSVIRDITDRRQIQAGLVQADRLSTFGMMAAGIAHEINNPLAYAMTNVDVLARRLATLAASSRVLASGDASAAAELTTALEQCAEMIVIAQEGMGRVRSIVRDLKMFSRDDAGAQERVDVRAVLESSINIARGEIRHRARVVREYRAVPFVSGSASRLGQVFLNLLVNAAHAIREGRSDGEIRVVTQTSVSGEAIIDIVDNGVGIEASAIDRIFDPFVTTKAAGEGTGLGLHIARTIARAAGGDVRASSRVGFGTTMQVSLPAAPIDAASKDEPKPMGEPRRTRILVVDDEVPIGLTLRALLSPPHEVSAVTSGRQALERIETEEFFDVIFCDIMMPEMSGIRFYELLRASHPKVAARIVFMTGGISAPEVHKFLQSTGARCLEKPFSEAELEAAIADALSS